MAGTVIHRKQRKLKAEINVVPYIDVMLVLLIIFMVTAPLLTLSVDVKLPSSTALATADSNEPYVVVAYPDGRYGLSLPGASQPEILADDVLGQRLAAMRSQQGDELRIMVAAEGTAQYQRVIDAMGVLRNAGITNVTLISDAGGTAR